MAIAIKYGFNIDRLSLETTLLSLLIKRSCGRVLKTRLKCMACGYSAVIVCETNVSGWREGRWSGDVGDVEVIQRAYT
jgi:hypothetical protein